MCHKFYILFLSLLSSFLYNKLYISMFHLIQFKLSYKIRSLNCNDSLRFTFLIFKLLIIFCTNTSRMGIFQLLPIPISMFIYQRSQFHETPYSPYQSYLSLTHNLKPISSHEKLSLSNHNVTKHFP